MELSTDDRAALDDWIYCVDKPFRVDIYTDEGDSLKALPTLRSATESDLWAILPHADAVVLSGTTSGHPYRTLSLPSGRAPLSLTDTLAELQSWPEYLEAALPDTVLADLDMCEGGQKLAAAVEDVVYFLRDLCEQIADRGFDRIRIDR